MHYLIPTSRAILSSRPFLYPQSQFRCGHRLQDRRFPKLPLRCIVHIPNCNFGASLISQTATSVHRRFSSLQLWCIVDSPNRNFSVSWIPQIATSTHRQFPKVATSMYRRIHKSQLRCIVDPRITISMRAPIARSSIPRTQFRCGHRLLYRRRDHSLKSLDASSRLSFRQPRKERQRELFKTRGTRDCERVIDA